MHIHSSLIQTAELYAKPVLGIREDDVVFSAAKLFFAYGLGNALTFPLAVGATAVLMAERPTPAAVFKRLKEHQADYFLRRADALRRAAGEPRSAAQTRRFALRVCTSAGEALPADLGRRWTEHFGVEILDGIGSTEMLHIFHLQPARARCATAPPASRCLATRSGWSTNTAAKWRPENSANCRSTARPARSSTGTIARRTPGDIRRPVDARRRQVHRDADGYYTYGGRSDDMLKVSGMYVSPFEVEAALMTHPDVLEAAVIGVADDQELIKPKAFVVTRAGVAATPALADIAQERTSRTGWRLTSIRAGSSSFPSCRRPRRGRSSASSCGRVKTVNA